MDFLQKTYKKSIKWSLAGSLATAIFQFAQAAIFARIAGPAASGDYALAVAVIGFLTPIAEAGISQSIVQADNVSRAQLRRLLQVNFALGACILLVLWLIGPSLAQWYQRPDMAGLILVMGASMLFTPLGAQRSAMLTKAMRFDDMARIEVIAWIVSLTVTTLLALQGWNAWAMANGFLVRNLVVTIASIIAMPKMPVDAGASGDVAPLLRFGFFDLTSRWAEFLLNYLDKLIVGKWLGVEALGFYNLAFTFLMLPTARLGYVITRVSFPVYARLKGQKAEVQAFFEQSSQTLVLVLFPVYSTLILFPKEIIYLIYGTQWLPAAPLFVAFGFAGFVRSLSSPFPQLMRGFGMPQVWLYWLLLLTAAINIPLLFVLHAMPDVTAAAWSRTVVKILLEIPLLWWLATMVGLEFKNALIFSLKWLAWLAPGALAVWFIDRQEAAFWTLFIEKAAVFAIWMVFLVKKGPLRQILR